MHNNLHIDGTTVQRRNKENRFYILCKRTRYSFLFSSSYKKETAKKKKTVVHTEQMIELAYTHFIDRREEEEEKKTRE